jgi:hypothetical protein
MMTQARQSNSTKSKALNPNRVISGSVPAQREQEDQLLILGSLGSYLDATYQHQYDSAQKQYHIESRIDQNGNGIGERSSNDAMGMGSDQQPRLN